jgi:lysophospholipase L1-like esterase
MLSPGRYVALGDSFTEGVGDRSKVLPNGVRGWADRVAEQLARHTPGWEYANLAVRSKRMRHIVDEQLDRAIDLRPTLVTLYAGGNDVTDRGTNLAGVMDRYDETVGRLTATGATVLLFTGYDVPLVPARQLFRNRNNFYNERVRAIAAAHGATLVDYWAFPGFEDRRMWAPDRLHMSKPGHRFVAAQVLDTLGVPHNVKLKERGELAPRTAREWEHDQRRWVHDWVVPLIGRKLRGVTLGDTLPPRWPEPVLVPARGGLRSLDRPPS